LFWLSSSRIRCATLAAVTALAARAVTGCGAPSAGASSPDAPSAAKDGGAATVDGGASAAAPVASAGRPFAASAEEATQLIGAAIDKHAAEMGKCIADYRTRKNLPHQRVEVSVGIDQDGRLLGATLKKGKADPALSECMMKALAGAAFPRSHSGVITMTKSYEDIVQ
jgi:hypothetical protein